MLIRQTPKNCILHSTSEKTSYVEIRFINKGFVVQLKASNLVPLPLDSKTPSSTLKKSKAEVLFQIEQHQITKVHRIRNAQKMRFSIKDFFSRCDQIRN